MNFLDPFWYFCCIVSYSYLSLANQVLFKCMSFRKQNQSCSLFGPFLQMHSHHDRRSWCLMRLTCGAFPIHIRSLNHDRRKIWSQTSDNMGKWSIRGGKSQRRERKKKQIREEKVLRERVRRKKSQAREKVEQGSRKGRKVWKDCVFHCRVVPAGRKVGSLNLTNVAGAEPCGGMRDRKLHAVVARSSFWSQNAKSTSCSEHFWKLRCSKSARCCGANVRNTFGGGDVEKVHAVVARRCAKHILKSTCNKHAKKKPPHVQTTWKVAMSKKCTPLWREVHSQVKTDGLRPLFGVRICLVLHSRRNAFCTLPIMNKTWGSRDNCKNDGRVASSKRICKNACRLASAVEEIYLRQGCYEVRVCQGADFVQVVVFWSMRSSGFSMMILGDRRSTSYMICFHVYIRGMCNTLDTWSGKVVKSVGTRPLGLHSTFRFRRTSHRIASFLRVSHSKSEEVSQNLATCIDRKKMDSG